MLFGTNLDGLGTEESNRVIMYMV